MKDSSYEKEEILSLSCGGRRIVWIRNKEAALEGV